MTTIEQQPARHLHPLAGVLAFAEQWNLNMEAVFIAGWLLVLDESMCPWRRSASNPAWVYMPDKPTKTGGMFHTMGCKLSGVMTWLELVVPKNYARKFCYVSRKYDATPFRMAPKVSVFFCVL